MWLLKIIPLIVFLQIPTITGYAQPSEKKDFFTLNDSVQTVSVMYNNKAMMHALTVGAISGGVVAGVSTILLVASGETGNEMVPWYFLPIAAGGVVFVLASTINYLLNSDDAEVYINVSSPYRPFNHLGLFSSFATILTSNSSNLDYSFSISYRNLNNKFYLPSKISLLYGAGQRTYLYESPPYSWCDISGVENRFGVEALYVNYNNLFSILYGVEAGAQFFNGSLFTYNPEEIDPLIEERDGISPYIHLIGGFNMNFTDWFSWEVTYKYEAYGTYDNLKPLGTNIINRNHFLSTTVAIYF